MIRLCKTELKKIFPYDERRDNAKELVRAGSLQIKASQNTADSYEWGIVPIGLEYSVEITYIDEHGVYSPYLGTSPKREPFFMEDDPRYHNFESAERLDIIFIEKFEHEITCVTFYDVETRQDYVAVYAKYSPSRSGEM